MKVSSRLVCLMAGGQGDRGTPIRLTLHINGNEERPGRGSAAQGASGHSAQAARVSS